MRILFFTQSGSQGASSRYRVYQYLPLLRNRGWTCWVAPGVPEGWHRAYFFSRCLAWKAFLSLGIVLRRWGQLFLVPFVDCVFIQKPLLPAGWPPLECFVVRLARKVVFDFDDAIFLPSPAGQRVFLEKTLGARFQKILRCADLILAGNAFLAAEALKFHARVEIFPTVVDAQRFVPRKGYNAPAVIGWMGSSTTAPYLRPLAELLQSLAQEFPMRLVLVGAGPFQDALGLAGMEGLDILWDAWDYSNEVAQLQSFDLFISPLDNTPWEQGKCGLKILTAMSAGLPVVASAVGVHPEIIQDGENGFLASTPQEWKDKLGRLLSDPALREKMGTQARNTVLRHYDLARTAERLDGLLRSGCGAMP